MRMRTAQTHTFTSGGRQTIWHVEMTRDVIQRWLRRHDCVPRTSLPVTTILGRQVHFNPGPTHHNITGLWGCDLYIALLNTSDYRPSDCVRLQVRLEALNLTSLMVVNKQKLMCSWVECFELCSSSLMLLVYLWLTFQVAIVHHDTITIIKLVGTL